MAVAPGMEQMLLIHPNGRVTLFLKKTHPIRQFLRKMLFYGVWASILRKYWAMVIGLRP